MELCTARSISTLPKLLSTAHRPLHLKPNGHSLSIPIRNQLHFTRSRRHLLSVTKAAVSEDETSSGPSQYVANQRDSVVAVDEYSSPVGRSGSSGVTDNEVAAATEEESSTDGQQNVLSDNFDIKFDSLDPYSIALYTGGALATLYLASAVVGAIDSIPLFPKLMEVVGLGYSFWFTTRYLLFKKNREELAAKIEELRQQVLGSNED